MKKVRLKDIAKEADVSISTVSRVINGDKSISVGENTTDKIWKLVHEMGYIRRKGNQNAKSDQIGESKKIGYILGDAPRFFDHPFYSVVLEGIENEIRNHGYSSAFYYMHKDLENQASFHKLITEEVADGILILADNIKEEHYEKLKQRFKDIVFINKITDEIDVDIISIDHEQSSYRAVKHLIDLGHEKIGFIGRINQGDSSIKQEVRYKGYKLAMDEKGLEIDKNYVKDGNFDMTGGFKQAVEVLENRNRPSAIFCSNDLMAIGAIFAINKYNLKIPEDISLVSYDNIKMAQFTHPPLTTVEVPKKEMGRLGARTLIQRIKGELNEPIRITLPTKLIIRESTSRLKSIDSK